MFVCEHRIVGAFGFAVAAVFTLLPGVAAGQARNVLERNLPPIVSGAGGLRGAGGVAVTEDAIPLGPTVTGIRLIGLQDPVLAKPPAGLSFQGIDGVTDDRLRKVLAPFVGRALSRRLVSEAQSAVAAAYRQAGRPFVSVTAPPQEITSGVLQLRVVPFRTGAVRVKDTTSDGATAGLVGAVRAPAGQLIEAEQISEDLDWLNRFPYRQLNGVFEPGSSLGTSDLTLEVTRKKPWQAFAGWSNTGTHQTDLNRYFVGFGVGVEAWNDLTLSYQLTGSGNLITDPSSISLSGTNWPSYVSHAGRMAIRTAPRQAIEITPSYVATSQNSSGNILAFENTTFELPILYRSALSNFSAGGAGLGELYVGVAPKWANRTTLYQTVQVGDGSAGVFDLIAGWAGAWQHSGGGSTALDLRLVANPGGVVGGNNAETWALFSNGRVTDINYVYAFGTLSRATPLSFVPAMAGWGWNVALTGQVAGQALPDTEQLAIGGYYATRGYALEDGSVDAGFVMRNELRLPAFAVLDPLGIKAPHNGAVQDALSPYLFADIGYGHNFNLDTQSSRADDANTVLVGVGSGIDYTLAETIRAGAVVGVALTDGPTTDRGTVTIQARGTLSF
jgi:hemolysin activation/secretion protein